MPYYRGDYYRGDYYQGDLLSGLKNFAKGAFNIVKGGVVGTLTGGPLGGLVGAVGGAVQTVQAGAHPSLPQPKQVPLITAGVSQQQTGLINVGPGNASQSGLINIAQGGMSIPGAITKGYHLNKSTYETRGGGTSRWGGAGNLQIHPKGTTLVKNRRMNVGNARALKRALRRAGGFARLARRVMSFTHPRAGRGHFKTSKRAKR